MKNLRTFKYGTIVFGIAWLGASPLFAQSTNETPAPAVTVTNQAVAVTNEPTAVAPPPLPPSLRPDLAAAFTATQVGRYGAAGRVLKLPVQTMAGNDAREWRRSFEFGLSMTQGNIDTLRYTAGLNLSRDRDADLTQFKANASYGESEDVKDTENASSTARYGRDLSKSAYALVSLDGAYDSIANLDYRLSFILSPGLRLIRTERTVLNIEAGAGYLKEEKGDVSRGFAAGRLAGALERILNPYVLAWCSGEYIPKLSDTGVFFTNAEVGLVSFLAQNLSLNIVFRERYDSDPAPDKTASDAAFTTSVSITF